MTSPQICSFESPMDVNHHPEDGGPCEHVHRQGEPRGGGGNIQRTLLTVCLNLSVADPGIVVRAVAERDEDNGW